MVQVFVIHGGTSFDSHKEYIDFIKTRDLTLERLRGGVDWRAMLARDLGDGFDVLVPRMPNGTNVRYEEWRIWFERCLELLDDNVIFVGHSLGGIFLAKYLSENEVAKKIKATFLVGAPYADTSTVESLKDFMLPDSLELFDRQGGKIFLVHSKDDPVVPFEETEDYLKRLSNAELMAFEDQAHFNQEHFPELVEVIREL